MKFEGPMDIRPLSMRGTFGIAWAILRRNFGAAFLYALAMQLLLALGALVAASPMLVGLIKSFNGADDLEIVLNVIVGALLLSAYGLAASLVFNPMFAGTLYGDFSARIYAPGAPAAKLFRRSGHSLRRFFITNLCLIAAMLVVNFAVSIVSGALGGMLGFTGLAASLFPTLAGGTWQAFEGALTRMSVSLIPYSVLAALLNGALELCGQSLVAFVYPIAVNENVRNFDAVGRSLKLAGKRLGRVLGAKALFSLAYVIAILIPVGGAAAVLAVAGVTSGALPGTTEIVLCVVLGLAAFVIALMGRVYSVALDTVLYYDARVRLEGSAWLGMGGEAQANAPRPEETNPNQNPSQQGEENNGGGGYGA